MILKLKRQSRLLTYVNSYSETYSAGCTSVKGKILVIYRKFSGKLPVIYGNSNIPNLTGNLNFQTLLPTTYARVHIARRLSTATALLLLLLSARDGDYVIFGPYGLIEATSGGDRATKKLQARGPSVQFGQTDRQAESAVPQ